MRARPLCIGCKKHPDEIAECLDDAEEAETTPDSFVRNEEGTYNPANGHFLCTECYIAMGSPSAPMGWVAP